MLGTEEVEFLLDFVMCSEFERAPIYSAIQSGKCFMLCATDGGVTTHETQGMQITVGVVVRVFSKANTWVLGAARGTAWRSPRPTLVFFTEMVAHMVGCQLLAQMFGFPPG